MILSDFLARDVRGNSHKIANRSFLLVFVLSMLLVMLPANVSGTEKRILQENLQTKDNTNYSTEGKNMTQAGDDFSFLDRPEVLQFIFHPRKDHGHKTLTDKVKDHHITVDEGVSIGCRFYICSKDSPNILYFHGNGEVVSDYDDIAPLYERIGVNLFVADYRGYGKSTGTPTVTNMLADAHKVFKAFNEIVKKENHTGTVFLMGRSLGSASAIELAYHYQKQLDGLIIESGFANLFELLEFLGFPAETLHTSKTTEGSNISKIRSVSVPTLVIHSQYDHIIPLKQGKALFDTLSAKDKRMLIIPDANHNDLMFVGMKEYFQGIKELVFPKAP